MGKILFLIFALFPVMSAGMPLSCQRGTTVVHDYGAILEKIPVLRVLLINDATEAQLSINGSYQITGSLTNIIDQGQGLQKAKIFVSNGGVTIGNKHYDNSELRITGLREGTIELNNVRYRGEIRILQQLNNKFSVIEEVDLEGFISGVLGGEMPHTWNEEALRAQAVTARTYAMYKKKVKQNEVYHLNMLDLAYRGMSSESPRLNKIVQDTKGVIMVYDWNIFPAYFHSTCGGHTEDAGRVFGRDSIPPLRGVTCSYCNNTKYSRWSLDIDKSEIERKLRNARVPVSNIHTVKAKEPGAGKHSSKVEIVSANGSKEMNANEFRLVVGPNYLYSTAFDSKNNGKNITFSGRGWGHGVGLCQYGAQGMAEKGFKWDAIIKNYYPQVELVRIY